MYLAIILSAAVVPAALISPALALAVQMPAVQMPAVQMPAVQMPALLILAVLIPAVLILAVLTVGYVYQQLGASRDRRRLLDRDAMVSLADGTRLYCTRLGSGSPAVIFESGIGATSQNWLALQRAVSEHTTAIAYDRAGLGWSSAPRTERTPANVARELREMLASLEVAPPFVLVGHSFGGLAVRRFALDYPDDVAGVVLVDPMRPEEWPPLNAAQSATVDRGIRLSGVGVHVARFGLARLAVTSLLRRSGRTSRAFSKAAGSGGAHVLDRVTCELNKLPREAWPAVAAHWSSPRFYRGFQAHLRGVRSTVREMQAAEPVAAPVIHFTAATSQPLTGEDLTRLGPQATQVFARGGHWLHLDEPELVLDAILGMVERARIPTPEPEPASVG